MSRNDRLSRASTRGLWMQIAKVAIFHRDEERASAEVNDLLARIAKRHWQTMQHLMKNPDD